MISGLLIGIFGFGVVACLVMALHVIDATDPRKPEDKARDVAKITREGF